MLQLSGVEEHLLDPHPPLEPSSNIAVFGILLAHTRRPYYGSLIPPELEGRDTFQLKH